ncbi:MAG: Holliday junction branch migration protein RuvA [Pseudomonadota bacterium]
MIARLKGVLASRGAGSVIVMTGGVGYEVFIPLSTFYELPDEGREVSLHIKTVVRDDALELFGFLTPGEKEAFLLLTSVSKIGPRLALSVLSGISPGELVEAVGTKNVARLSRTPGIGTKTAERLVVELKDKIARLAAAFIPPKPSPEADDLDQMGQDVVSALINLGYSKAEAQKAVTQSLSEADKTDGDLPSLLRSSLKKLQKV